MTPKTILIGLDGATFTVLDPLMADGKMPTLRGLIESGARAPLRSIIPALTPPAWTSLMTGKRPGQHGVFDFFRKEQADSQYFRFSSSQDIDSATIWSLANQQGHRVTALNFPLMFPAPAVDGCVVPGGWMPWRQLRLGCYPPGLFDRLKALPSFNARELALDMALEEKAIEGCAADEYVDWINLHMRRERRWLDILKYLMKEESADLTAILFDGVDKLQHLLWRFLDPTSRPETLTPFDQEIQGLCEAYFRQLDDIIAEIVGLAGPDTTVVLASDHGFGPTSDVFYVNTWLEQQGYLTWAESTEQASTEAPKLGLGQIARHVFQLDWSKTIAYAPTPSSNGINIVVRTPDNAGGVAADAYEQVRRELKEKLLELRHPVTGKSVVAEVWSREEIFPGPHQDLGPDLTLVLADGGLVSILRSDEVVKPRPQIVGTHRPEGIFIAKGPGIRTGVVIPELSLLDVAPTLLYSLGVPIPSDVVGKLPVAAFEAEFLKAHPVEVGEVTESRGTPVSTQDDVFDAEAEATMFKRLRALGYVE